MAGGGGTRVDTAFTAALFLGVGCGMSPQWDGCLPGDSNVPPTHTLCIRFAR